MRLIDADALKEEFRKDIMGGLNWERIIDNAPTVEPFEKVGAICNENCEMTRPQGERGKWIISEIRCPNCLEYFQTECYSTEELKKCPNCGADMRKESDK